MYRNITRARENSKVRGRKSHQPLKTTKDYQEALSLNKKYENDVIVLTNKIKALQQEKSLIEVENRDISDLLSDYELKLNSCQANEDTLNELLDKYTAMFIEEEERIDTLSKEKSEAVKEKLELSKKLKEIKERDVEKIMTRMTADIVKPVSRKPVLTSTPRPEIRRTSSSTIVSQKETPPPVRRIASTINRTQPRNKPPLSKSTSYLKRSTKLSPIMEK